MANKGNRDFDNIIEGCKERGVYDLMALQYDWNEEVICQFYSTLFIDPSTQGHIHWMTQGIHYDISMARFSTYFPVVQDDRDRERMDN